MQQDSNGGISQKTSSIPKKSKLTARSRTLLTISIIQARTYRAVWLIEKRQNSKAWGTFWTLKKVLEVNSSHHTEDRVILSISSQLVALWVRVLTSTLFDLLDALRRQQLRIEENFKPQGRASDNDLSTTIRKRRRPLVVRDSFSFYYGSGNLKRDPTAKLTLRTFH